MSLLSCVFTLGFFFSGGSVTDSRLIQGVAFKKTFSYAGFEQQPKHLTNPRILLLNVELG